MQPLSKTTKSSYSPWHDPVCVIVREWPAAAMSAADKITFFQLWELSNCGRETISVTASMIGNFQGTSSDAGKDRLENLRKRGLVNVIDRKAGVWKITLADPRTVAEIRGVPWDGQLELDFPHDESETSAVACGPELQLRSFAAPTSSVSAEEPPEVPPEEPRSLHLLTPSGVLKINTPSTFRTPSEKVSLSNPKREAGGTSGASSGDSSAGEPKTAGSIMQAALAKLAPAKEHEANLEARAIAIAEWIKSRVQDPKLFFSPCKRAAWAIVEGRIKRGDVDDVLDRLDKLRPQLQVPPSVYFTAGLKRILARAGEPLR